MNASHDEAETREKYVLQESGRVPRDLLFSVLENDAQMFIHLLRMSRQYLLRVRMVHLGLRSQPDQHRNVTLS